jgi:hypothetical protein
VNSLFFFFFEQILSNNLATTSEDKLTILNLLDEFNFRNEILHQLATKKISQNLDIKETSDRLGKKFMSSVKK